MGAFTILTYLFESSPQIFKKGSSNIQISVGKMQGNLAAANDITATALERSTAVVNTGTGNVYISGISEERFQQIAEELGVTRSALNNFFRILEQKQVSPEELDTRLRDIAKNYKELQEKLKAFTAGDPVVVALKQEASQVLEAGDFLRVEQLLIQASERDLEAAKQLQEAATERLLSAAASKAEIGTLKMIELAYRDSTAYFRQAVDLVPRDAPLTRADYLNDL
ncbi:MAG TPA: hypothetical protein VLK82_03660, partial [Candidatus Tectomicrobia bacterium]|nr:hypothetical protein [Candidatus Tectomicrobia bacterium]